jgi:ribokinase
MKALTIGGAMIDTIAVIADERIERMTMRNADASFLLLEEGRKNDAKEISTHCGGGAVNAAVALARLGFDVAALIKLGQDGRAETILAKLADEGVSTRFAVRDKRAPTGASVLVSAHDRNAAIFTARGANTLLDADDLKTDAFATDLVYVSSLSNNSADCFSTIVHLAKATGALVAVNPGIRQLSARQAQLLESMSNIDILAVNAYEAGTLVPLLVSRRGEGGPLLKVTSGDLPLLARRGFVAGGFELSLARFFEGIHEMGPKWVVITDGQHGAYASSPTGIVHCPAMPVKAAGTTGAGDAFNATFSAYVTKMASTEDSLIAAGLNAASVIGYVDTQTGLLQREKLEEQIEEAKRTVKLKHLTK